MKDRKIRSGHIIAAVIFIAYMCGLSYFLFFSPMMGRHHDSLSYLNNVSNYRDYNLKPFRLIRIYIEYADTLGFKYIFLNLYGNVLCFMPFGFLIAFILNGKHKFINTIFIAAIVSTIIELLQYIFAVGTGDIDDVILNTCGAVLGYAVYVIINKIFRRGRKKVN
ncbi:MAG: VanZ family protein [Clostridiales bacterium]|nr:VanZ family protein [Clostridiales bacterium]MBS5877873.1 VanZ family protein [Clostridiales bacterium]MDU3490870.1 VanZ family protein [Clostridiales bacterium]